MKFKTFLAILFAIAAVVAVAAVVISKRRISLASDDEFTLDDYENAYEGLNDYESCDCENCADIADEATEKVASAIEKTSEKVSNVTDDFLSDVDDVLEKTSDSVREIRRF
jgi:DNA-binding transcriptional MerR regulator